MENKAQNRKGCLRQNGDNLFFLFIVDASTSDVTTYHKPAQSSTFNLIL